MSKAAPLFFVVALVATQSAAATDFNELLRRAVSDGVAAEERVDGLLADFFVPRFGEALYAGAIRSGKLDENGCARYTVVLRAGAPAPGGTRGRIAELSLDLCVDLLPPAASINPGHAARLLTSP